MEVFERPSAVFDYVLLKDLQSFGVNLCFRLFPLLLPITVVLLFIIAHLHVNSDF